MRAQARTAAIAFVASVLLGVVGGLVWAVVAPRALLQEVSQGTAEVVNAETSAFIAADGWFCVISAVCGLVAGVLGCWLAVRRARALAALVAAVFAPLFDGFLFGANVVALAVVAMSCLLIWRHRGNIAKLMAGKESRIGDKKKPETQAAGKGQ